MVHEHDHHDSWWHSPAKIALYIFLAIAAFFLITEHLAHLAGILPYLLLLACPFMHLFMHGGHGGHGGHSNGNDQSSR